MNFLNDIKEKTIIICPNDVKRKLLYALNSLDKLVNIKMYSLDELKHMILFDYDKDAVLYLMDKYGYSTSVALEYINNLYYVDIKDYSDDKLNDLVNIKKELIDKKLIKFSNYFIECNKDVQFIIFGYDYLTSFDKKLLSSFDYKVISKDEINTSINVYDIDAFDVRAYSRHPQHIAKIA